MLIARSGVLEGNTYPVAGRLLIGRDGDCDVQVMDPAASRKHASVLAQEDGTVLLRDLKSHNGTTVDGKVVREVVLSPGDDIVIGTTHFEYQIIDGGKRRTQELELRLVSGPAQEPTLVGPVPSPMASPEMLSPEQPLLELPKTEFPGPIEDTQRPPEGEVTQTHPLSAFVCCGSPLAARARAEGWKHCPACGAPIKY